jgi:hypothetical protein
VNSYYLCRDILKLAIDKLDFDSSKSNKSIAEFAFFYKCFTFLLYIDDECTFYCEKVDSYAYVVHAIVV